MLHFEQPIVIFSVKCGYKFDCIYFVSQDILEEMRKELAKLKEELIDGKCSKEVQSCLVRSIPCVISSAAF